MKQHLKKAEIAQLLKVTPRTVDNWVRRGVLPIVRIGRIVRFPADECAEAIQRYTRRKRATGVILEPLGRVDFRPTTICEKGDLSK